MDVLRITAGRNVDLLIERFPESAWYLYRVCSGLVVWDPSDERAGPIISLMLADSTKLFSSTAKIVLEDFVPNFGDDGAFLTRKS